MWVHRLSNIDLDNKKATCSNCGQVAIYVFKSGNACINRRKEARKHQYQKEKLTRKAKPKVERISKDVLSSAEKSKYIKEQKNKPCMDCGISFPYYVMDFDHRNPSEKTANLARMIGSPFSEIVAEIEKCDVVCANCHRERTYGKKTTPSIK